MNSLLRPPTTRYMRDEVVAPRRYGVPYVDARPQQTTNNYSTSSWDSRCESPEGTNTVYDGQFSPMDRKRKRQEPSTDLPSSKLMMLAVSSGDRVQHFKPEPQFKVGDEEKTTIMEWVDTQRKHQREIRRLRQIRYRKKKEDYTVQLGEETRQLQQQIEKLEQRRRAVSAAVPTEKALWNVAVEYFRLFRFGLRASVAQDTTPSAQLDFLRSTMAPDVMFNAGRGVESILRNWKYFTLWFQDVEVELDGVKKGGVNSLVAAITTRFTITERSLMTVFPHLCATRGRGGFSIADKLLGQRIVMKGLTRFDWDSGYGRVTSVISESDMLTPMLQILGSLEDVSKAFEKSLISLTPYRGQIHANS